MTRFIESQSRWGDGYRRRYYLDGWRVSEHEFSRAYLEAGLTAELGAMESTSYGFRKIWETAPAGYLETIAALEEIPEERRATIAAMALGDYFEGVAA